LHYLGSPSRRLFLAKYQGDTPDENSIITNEQDSTVGHVVSASMNEAQLTLVSLKLSEINQDLYLNSETLTLVKALANTD
jgi:folate-binding Fe-S cluster repair protein YgfZ